MKALVLLFAGLMIVSGAEAAKPKKQDKLCKSLRAKAERTCDKAMCDDAKEEDPELKDCERDGDWNVALQECVYTELEEAAAKLNKKYPNKPKVDCNQ